MRRMILVVATLATGCAHTVPAGLDTMQKGMALVDVGTKSAVDSYKELVDKVRAYCDGDEDCEKRYHVTDSDVDKVVEAGESLSFGYDTVVRGMDDMTKAWSVIGPAMEELHGMAEDITR